MVVVFGSLNADLTFQVSDLPQAGETVLTKNYSISAGGKGANQAVAAARFGVETIMVGCVGKDKFGNFLISQLGDAGVCTGGVNRDELPTGCAAIGVDKNGQNQIMVAGGANLKANAANVPDKWLTPQTTLLLQMEVALQQNWAVAQRVKTAGGRVLVNVAPVGKVPEDVMKFIDVILVNQIEVLLMAKNIGIDETDPKRAAMTIADRYGIWCVVTLGYHGAAGYSPDEKLVVGALQITPADTTGAGDAFCGVLAAALDKGWTMSNAIHHASVAGSLKCLQPGAQTRVTASQIQAHLKELEPPRVVS
jgi:ribokinase